MTRYDRTYALAHAATLILAVGAIYILLDACEWVLCFQQSEIFSGFRRGAGICVAWCRFNAFMTAIRASISGPSRSATGNTFPSRLSVGGVLRRIGRPGEEAACIGHQTCRRTVAMSVFWGRPEVAVIRSNRQMTQFRQNTLDPD